MGIQQQDTAGIALLDLYRRLTRDHLVTAAKRHHGQRAIAQLGPHQGIDGNALDLLVVDEVVVVLGVQLRQASRFDQLLDLRGAGLLLGFFLLLAVQFLVTLGFLGHGFLGHALLAVVHLDLAFVLQAFLFLLGLVGLGNLFLVDQTGFEQLVAKGKAHECSLTYATAQPQLGRFFS